MSGLILTITPNPSIDRTLEVGHFQRGTVVRGQLSRIDPGGKGINVAQALAANGVRCCAVLPCGGFEGALIARLLNHESIDLIMVPVAALIRVNLTVVEPDHTVTKINELGPTLTETEVEALEQASIKAAQGAAWVVCCGSLPPGVPESFYARLIEPFRAVGACVAVDTAGKALTRCLPAGPDLVKPNREELSEATGRRLASLGDAVAAAGILRERGAKAVLASLGPDGAILVDAEGAWHAEARVHQPLSTVGAGDALLAGFLAAGAKGPAALAEAVAWAAAACRLPGSQMPSRSDMARDGVRVSSARETVLLGRLLPAAP